MKKIEFHYKWDWQLSASPQALWPLISDTNRFNRDTGVPQIRRDNKSGGDASSLNRRQRLRLLRFGVPLAWEEEPFEWVRPYRYGVVRHYRSGPVKEMRVLARATLRPDGGTHLTYEVWAKPGSVLGLAAIPAQIGVLSAYSFNRTFKRYAALSAGGQSALDLPSQARLAPGAYSRLQRLRSKLLNEGANPSLADLLIETLLKADDVTLARLRPYALADHWKVKRKDVLELCLLATRAGLLDLRWDIICPLCRGAKSSSSTLNEAKTQIHCDSCKLDFTADFDRLIELTFRPNPAVREVHLRDYCVGGPQVTPHVVAQQLLPPSAERTVTLPLEEGRYRLRTAETRGVQMLLVGEEGQREVELCCSPEGWSREEVKVGNLPSLHLKNASENEQLFILERMAWNDQAATAGEVTALQRFRDLFAAEALRAGEQVSVGTLAILFTDLRGSTNMYREIGDAPAFGRVMTHFDVLKKIIAEEDGAVIKTIGDSVMAVFRLPVSALRATLRVQAALSSINDGLPPLQLKAGIHSGPCIAVTLNDRLDYFGTTVNIAARLENLSLGEDVVISSAVLADPQVAAFFAESDGEQVVEPFEATLKGYGDERFELWRIHSGGNCELPAHTRQQSYRPARHQQASKLHVKAGGLPQHHL
ncbi:MAG: adenylate/guanylate cyclase domain-containing protein [Chloroflexi bacterium]|nr:adenylate/guanylate cyclase domain-containing protein [Chloroflexota bacterium]